MDSDKTIKRILKPFIRYKIKGVVKQLHKISGKIKQHKIKGVLRCVQ